MSKFNLNKLSKETPTHKYESAFINLKPYLGNFDWCEFLFLIGGAQAGKSYAICDFFVSQYRKDGTPFYWIRLTEAAAQKLLRNNAELLVDPDIKRRYNLDLVTSAGNVYEVTKRSAPDKKGQTKILEKKLMARVLSLSTFYKTKGAGYFDKDYKGWYNIGMDEFQPEANEKHTFDIVYGFVRTMENLVRNTSTHVRIIGAANLLQEASDILCCFNFIPETWGTYKLKSKRCVIAYLEPTDAYKKMRKDSIAQMLLPNSSMYSNEQQVDDTLVDKRPLITPQYIIKFSKDKDHWYTVWNHGIVCKYNKENKDAVAMRPYLDEVYNVDRVKAIIELFDTRSFHYRNLITFKQFQADIELLKPRK